MAHFVAEAGVNRIFVDLEQEGKFERQGHRNTLISRHEIADVAAVRKAAPGVELLVRINPWSDERSPGEVEAVIAAGADLIMLPMIRDSGQVRRLGAAVAGRAAIIPLIETVASANAIGEIAALTCVHELYIGLNDLHMELGCRFMFEPLADGLVDRLAAEIRPSGKPFGFGGIARVGEGMLPAELVLGEHVRLGSTRVILSRTFHRMADDVAGIQADMDFGRELAKLRQCETDWRNASAAELARNHEAVRAAVATIIGKQVAQ
ncbi:aldolase/citrate lyase family protein [Fluviicoccus keumensis]|nr:aldolase/citrate lyase family protein [Fluviicoccus keumensis]